MLVMMQTEQIEVEIRVRCPSQLGSVVSRKAVTMRLVQCSPHELLLVSSHFSGITTCAAQVWFRSDSEIIEHFQIPMNCITQP